MKKFLAGIAAAAIITVPMTSFALESMSKGALKKATGQAGVSIALDDIVIVQKSNPTTTFWDMDGVSSITGTQGLVTSAGLRIAYTDASQKLMVIDGILDGSKYGAALLNTTFKIQDQAAKYAINSVGISAASTTTGTVTDVSTGASEIGNTNINVAEVNHTATAYEIAMRNAQIAAITAANNADTDTSNDVTVPAALTSASVITDQAAYTVAAQNYQNGISPLTIDIGTCKSLTAGLHYNAGATQSAQQQGAAHLDVAGVVIGLPTVEITTYHSDDTKVISIVTGTPGFVANSGSTVANVSNEMIRITKSGASQMAILGGRVEIAPH